MKSSNKTILALLCAGALAASLLTGCGQGGGASSQAAASAATGGGQATTAMSGVTSEKVKAEDLDASWDEASATKITLNGDSAAVDGQGAAAEGGVVTIGQAGTYVVSGALDDGQIVVDAPAEALVRLVLNGASLHCATSAPIDCRQADKLVVILADGTENTLSDSDSYVFPDEATDEPSAALFSKADLTINGTGSLAVNASYNNGIGTKDDLIIVSGAITVDAVGHAVRGRDSVTVLDGELTLTAGNDGIQSNNDSGEADKGWIELYGGTFAIQSAHDGIQAETTLTVYGGTYDITAGGGSAGASASATTDSASDSYKGIKAAGALTVYGGAFHIDSADDGVHSNSDILISGGSLAIATGDDGVHADTTLTVEGDAVIDVTQSYEGLESATVTIKGGTIRVVASDDGINAAGGRSDETTAQAGGGFGRDSFAAAGDYLIRIEGGDISVTAGADGLDSNGDIEIAGGNILINMTNYQMTGGGDGALDRDGNMTITGGTVTAASGVGIVAMGQGGGQGSTQATLEVYYTDRQSAGTLVELKDENGNTLASFTPANDFQSVVLTAAGMAEGSAYTLYTGGAETVTATLSGAVTSLQDTGEAATNTMGGGMGGRGNMGGMPADMGEPPTGMGEPPADMGQPPTDMGEPPADMGEPPTGTPPAGAGQDRTAASSQ